MGAPNQPFGAIRPTWSRKGTVARRVVQPLQSFLQEESASGLLVLAAAAAALLWANSPWRESYQGFWGTDLGFHVGGLGFELDLRHWVNDGLMSLFFVVVGLEIKRELTTGELRDPRAAAVPVVAAVGGMLLPGAIYFAINAGGAGASGWGIPMATDLAFALGVLAVAARWAPASLRPFLLTLAIVDDIGAILVIAVFYPTGGSAAALVTAIGVVLFIVVLHSIDVRAVAVYVFLGACLWVALFEAGVHPAIAGVILGLLTPSTPFQRPRAVSEEAHRIADETVDDPNPPDADAPQWLRLATLSREAVSPLARVEAALHPWTTTLVVPVFALANAGVVLSRSALAEAVSSPVTVGIVAGLVVGKTLGIAIATAVIVRMGRGRLPSGARWRHVVGVAAIAGIGFTVSLLVADLAFGHGRLEDHAKIGILVASVLAGTLGYTILRTAASVGSTEGSRSGPPGVGEGFGQQDERPTLGR